MKAERATWQAQWRQEAPAWLRRNVVGATLLIAVILLSLLVGYRIADYRVRGQETAVAADIDESIDHVLTAIRSNERKLAGLAGRPCAEVKAQLTFADAFIPYRTYAKSHA